MELLYAAAIFLIGYIMIQFVASWLQPELATYWWRCVIKGEHIDSLPSWLKFNKSLSH